MRMLAAVAVLGLVVSACPVLMADPCSTVSVSLPASRSGTIPTTCFDVGVVAGTAFVDYVIVYQFSVPAGRTIGATLQTGVQQPLLFLLDSAQNPLEAQVGSDTDVEIAYPQAVAGTYYLLAGVPADQAGASFSVAITASPAPPVINHTTAKDVEDSDPFDPVNPTKYFLPTDSVAWSWVEVGPISGIHQIDWKFIEPDGRNTVYSEATTIIGDAGSYDWWKTSEGIYVFGHLPARMLGDWRVDVSVDGVAAFSDTFTITNTPPCDPSVHPRCGVRIISPRPPKPRGSPCQNIAGQWLAVFNNSCRQTASVDVGIVQNGCSISAQAPGVGSLSGTVNGSGVAFTVTEGPQCAGSVSGTATIAGRTITGTYAGHLTCCDPVSGSLTLTRTSGANHSSITIQPSPE